MAAQASADGTGSFLGAFELRPLQLADGRRRGVRRTSRLSVGVALGDEGKDLMERSLLDER